MTGSDVEARIYAAELRMRAGDAWFQKWPLHSWDDLERFVGMSIRSPRARDFLFEQIRTRGDGNGHVGLSLPAAAPGLKHMIMDAFKASFETDPVSAMAGNIVPRTGDGTLSWRVFDEDPLTANFTEGQFGRVSGPYGSGKTAFSGELMRRYIARGNLSFSNIKADPLPEGFTWTTTTTALIRAGVGAAKLKKRWLFVLDEPRTAGLVKSEWMTKRARELDRLVPLIRKLRGNMVLNEHRPESVPSAIAAFATNLFYCHSPGDVSIDLRGPNLTWEQRVRDFPETKFPYNTRDFPLFKVETNVLEMMDSLEGRADQLDAILEYIEAPHPARKASSDPRPRDSLGRLLPHKSLLDATKATTTTSEEA